MQCDWAFGSLFIQVFHTLVLSYFGSSRKEMFSILAQIIPWKSFGKRCLAFVTNILMPPSEILGSFSFMAHKICIIYCCFGTFISLSSSYRVRSHGKRKGKCEKNANSDWVKEQRATGPWQGAREVWRISTTSQRNMLSWKRLIKLLFIYRRVTKLREKGEGVVRIQWGSKNDV